jgi:hypothetical protein
MRMRVFISAVVLTMAMPAVAVAPASAMEPSTFVVTQDQAKLLRIAAPAATIIIGNPAIADATMQDNQTLVITGRSSGTTNLIILDDLGEPIAEQLISVEGPGAHNVSLFRGPQRFSFNCVPNCQPNLVPGDNEAHFKLITDQNAARTGSASGSAAVTEE